MADAMVEHSGMSRFKALQNSLYSCAIIAMIGGGLFLYCSLYIQRDRARADAVARGMSVTPSHKTLCVNTNVW